MMRRAGLSTWVASLLAAGSWAQEPYPFCQILDGTELPAWQAAIDYTASARVQADVGDDISIWRFLGGGGLYYWRTQAGDVDLSGLYDLWAWEGDGGIDLPDLTAALRLKADYTYRTWAGSAVRVGFKPGFYTTLEDVSFESLYFPFEVLGIQTFNPQISGVIGVAIYPGFDRVFDPRFGVRVAPVPEVRVDLMYPESRVVYRPAEWEVFGGVRHEAVNEFRLEDGDPRELIGFRETRAYVGGAWPATEVLRIQVDVGLAFNREVDFESEAPARDVEDAWFVRIGVGGAL
ncbi:MAG: hypothetical protein NZ740_06410 [Kiritimatiellae bacterium]|nr:hypothetical protein [Kiritimatiellia bacterium]MDW8458728.1 hypothetical protein [Verrucomicrobiota bacterium]